MRLAEYLDEHRDEIVQAAADFAQTMPALQDADQATLKDHFSQFIEAVSSDIKTLQSRTQSIVKSLGDAPRNLDESAAEEHGVQRARMGLSAYQVVSEYRALRSSVLRMWADQGGGRNDDAADVMRFNEAIDQAICESIDKYEQEVDRWRSIFLGVVGHDLRTPLNAVNLTCEVIKARVPENLTLHADVLIRSVKRMSTMLDSLLEYSQSQIGSGITLQKSDVDLGRACNAEIDILHAAMPEANIEFTCEQDLHVHADASRVREAMSNLVNNAVKHGTGQAAIVTIRSDDKYAYIEVQNAGAIPVENQREIFEPLKRGDAVRGGDRTNLGLGLFICKQIAVAHEGDITVTSIDGLVHFVLKLPKFKP